MLEDFAASRQLIARVAEEACVEASAIGDARLAALLSAETRKLATEDFDLAVVGEFKRGKSTLVNALIGADVLSTASVPLTSVVTVVRHGAAARAVVCFVDGRREDIALGALETYTTERSNPSNAKRIARVEVEYPAPALIGGVRVIDTPGIGSVHAQNTAVTLQFIPHVDAALMVFGADQPASRSELEFLDQIRPHVEKVFFVLNKIDLVAPAEREETVAFVQDALARHLGGAQPRLYTISARLALGARLETSTDDASGITVLETDVAAFLAAHRGAVLLGAARRRVRAWIAELAGTLELRRAALLMPVTTLDQRIDEFRSRSERVRWSRATVEGMLTTASRRLVDALEETHGPFVASHASGLIASLERVWATTRGGRRELIEALDRALEAGVQHALDEWAAVEAQRVHREVAAILDRLRAEARAIVGELTSLVRELFGTVVHPAIELADFSVEPPHARLESMFSLMLDDVPLLLPTALARRMIRRRFIGAAPEELARNLSRATAEFRQRLVEATRVFAFQFAQHVDRLITSLNDALARTRDDRLRAASAVTSAVGELDRHAAALAALLARTESGVQTPPSCQHPDGGDHERNSNDPRAGDPRLARQSDG